MKRKQRDKREREQESKRERDRGRKRDGEDACVAKRARLAGPGGLCFSGDIIIDLYTKCLITGTSVMEHVCSQKPH